MIMGAEVSFDDVSLVYPLGDGSSLAAVDQASFAIRPGELVTLRGTSGSGKSSLLNLMGAMIEPTSGSISVDGVDLTTLTAKAAADYRSRVGFVFQQFHLIGVLTALDNVCVPLVGRTRDDPRDRGRQALASVGLADRADAYPAQLSGGQLQRVAIARALVVEPTLILADEPTGQLDSATSAEIKDLLLTVHQTTQATICIASHDQSITEIGDRRFTVSDGVVTEA